jgi:hypothetical protein
VRANSLLSQLSHALMSHVTSPSSFIAVFGRQHSDVRCISLHASSLFTPQSTALRSSLQNRTFWKTTQGGPMHLTPLMQAHCLLHSLRFRNTTQRPNFPLALSLRQSSPAYLHTVPVMVHIICRSQSADVDFAPMSTITGGLRGLLSRYG